MKKVKILLVFAGLAASAGAQERLSLEEAVRVALEKNPSLEAGVANVRAAQARIEQARSGYYPNLRYSESYTRSNNPVFAFSSLLLQRRFSQADFAIDRLNRPPAIQNFQSQLTAEQLIYDFGGRKRQVESATIGKSLAQEGDRQIRMSVIDGVLATYYHALLSDQMARTADEALKSAEADLERAKAVRAAGMSTDADVLSIEVHLAQVREQKIRRDFDAQVARAALNEALGLPLDTDHQLTTSLAVAAMPAEELPALEQTALRLRPEAQQSTLSVSLADSQIGVARSGYFPKIYARGGVEANRYTYVTQGGGNWTAAAALEWNFSTGMRDRAKVKEAQAMAEQSRAEQRRVASRLQLEVRQAYLNLQASQERIKAAEAAVSQARESLRIIKNRYESGLATVTDLLRNETAALEATTRHQQAIHDQRLAAAALEMAAGRLGPDSPVLQ